MSLSKRVVYFSLALALTDLTGCVSPSNNTNRQPSHNPSYYHQPSVYVNPKDDLANYVDKDLAKPFEKIKEDIERKLGYILPFKPKVGKSDKIKAKPGIYYDVEWRRAVNLFFPTSQSP